MVTWQQRLLEADEQQARHCAAALCIPVPTLKAQRTATRMTVAEFASLLGVAATDLALMERGQRPVSAVVKRRLRRLLHAEVCEPVQANETRERLLLGALVLRAALGWPQDRALLVAARFAAEGWPFRKQVALDA